MRRPPPSPPTKSSPEDKTESRLLSTSRLKALLMVFMAGQLLCLSGLVVAVVTRIFDRITPVIHADLTVKAQRGARELARGAAFSISAGDNAAVYGAFADLRKDVDIVALAAVDMNERVLATHGVLPEDLSTLFAGKAGEVRADGPRLVSWSLSTVEDFPVGKVAAVVSLARLEEGSRLRAMLLAVAALFFVASLVSSILFVNLYIGPLVALTHRSLETAREMVIAKAIQTSLLPQANTWPHFDVAASMHPTDEVGGDYYDVIADPGGDGVWIAIGDVSGHGLQAGLITLMVESIVFSLIRARPDIPPVELVSALNDTLHENIRKRMHADDFVTFSVLRCRSDGQVTIAGAHEDVLVLRRSTGHCEKVAPKGVWLGLKAGIGDLLRPLTLKLEEGDTVLLYTDGVTEALGPSGHPLGPDGLVALVEQHASDSPSLMRQAILKNVLPNDTTTLTKPEDDMTLVVARYRSRADAAGPIPTPGPKSP